MCAIGVRNGTHTVGDFVMVNAMMIQLYQPLNLMGMVYREIKQAIIDIEQDVRRADAQCGGEGSCPVRSRCASSGGRCDLRTCGFPTIRIARS